MTTLAKSQIEEARTQARALRAIADPTRLLILRLLSREGDSYRVGELAQQFTLTQPSVSCHLRVLLDAGLIDYRKEGRHTYYFVCRPRILALRQIIDNLV